MGTREKHRLSTAQAKPMPFPQGTPGKYLYKRGKTSFEIDAEMVRTNPLEIVFTDPGSKALAGGHRKVYRVLRTHSSAGDFAHFEKANSLHRCQTRSSVCAMQPGRARSTGCPQARLLRSSIWTDSEQIVS